MARRLTASILAAFAVSVAGVALAAGVPANITAALADKARPEADVKRDADRHPGEMLAFAGVKPGDKVADFMMGGGYFTAILSPAVGPKGKVYAYQSAEFIQFRAAYGDEQKKAAAGRDNVVALTGPLSAVGLPDGSKNLEAVDTAIHHFLADGTIDRLSTRWLGAKLSNGDENLPLIRTEQ